MIEKREKEREVSERQRRWKVNVINEKKNFACNPRIVNCICRSPL